MEVAELLGDGDVSASFLSNNVRFSSEHPWVWGGDGGLNAIIISGGRGSPLSVLVKDFDNSQVQPWVGGNFSAWALLRAHEGVNGVGGKEIKEFLDFFLSFGLFFFIGKLILRGLDLSLGFNDSLADGISKII